MTETLKLIDRLRGVYTVPVNDGLGLLNGKDTYTPPEPFFTPPIQKEAAERIEVLTRAIRDAKHALLRGEAAEARWILIKVDLNG